MPFLATEPEVPGKNAYPWGTRKDALEAFLARHPQARDFILDINGAGPSLGGMMIEASRPFAHGYLPTFTSEKLEAVLQRAGTTFDPAKAS